MDNINNNSKLKVIKVSELTNTTNINDHINGYLLISQKTPNGGISYNIKVNDFINTLWNTDVFNALSENIKSLNTSFNNLYANVSNNIADIQKLSDTIDTYNDSIDSLTTLTNNHSASITEILNDINDLKSNIGNSEIDESKVSELTNSNLEKSLELNNFSSNNNNIEITKEISTNDQGIPYQTININSKMAKIDEEGNAVNEGILTLSEFNKLKYWKTI